MAVDAKIVAENIAEVKAVAGNIAEVKAVAVVDKLNRIII
jgi:hypothetical protein